MNFTDIPTMLIWIVNGTGALLIASWLLDKIPAFGTLQPNVKSAINLGVALVLALGSYAALTYIPPSYIDLAAPWFTVIMTVVLMYSGQQVYHAVTK